MDQEIYILSHKEFDYNIDLSDYIPIQTGAELFNKDLFIIRDNAYDNISNKNHYFFETTGIYWIWKNSNADIKGQMQFRRFLSVNPKFINNILNKYDIITANPFIVPSFIPSVEFHYSLTNNIDDLLEVKNIISQKYPEYIQSYDKYIRSGRVLYYSNSFIAKKEIYDSVCEFCFSILFEFDKKFNLSNKDNLIERAKAALNSNKEWKMKYMQSHSDLSDLEYQSAIPAFLFERLFTLYILHNNLKIYNCGDYILMDNRIEL